MHELSLIKSIAQEVLQSAQKHQAVKVTQITLEIGEFLSIDSEQINFWLKKLFENTIAQDARIKLHCIKSLIKCLDCNYEGTVKIEKSYHFHFHPSSLMCPQCSSYKIKIIQGNECYLKDIQLITK